MLFRTNVKWAVGLVVLAIAATPAVAQTVGSRSSTDGRVDSSRQVVLPVADELRESDNVLQRMELARGGIRRQLESARAARDVVKTLCLNDKLNQLDVTKRTAKERAVALASAADRKDTESANHEFTILKVLQQRSEQLTQEANSCVGEQEAFVGAARVTQTIGDNLPPNGNETEFPQPDPNTLVVDPPQCTSCIR